MLERSDLGRLSEYRSQPALLRQIGGASGHCADDAGDYRQHDAARHEQPPVDSGMLAAVALVNVNGEGGAPFAATRPTQVGQEVTRTLSQLFYRVIPDPFRYRRPCYLR